MEQGGSLDRALRAAYRFLAVRDRSERELRTMLAGKGFGKAERETVLAKLREQGYLDDASFAGKWARNLAVNRLLGNLRIEMSLREKGIAENAAREAVARARRELGEEEAIGRLIEGWMKGRKLSALDEREKRRFFQRLAARGFPAGLIYGLIKNRQGELRHDDDGE
ncbi:MAG: RecX family transcriptional regulator [Deltaproteobacteria bacterium]|nr:RecX family transcriptional regulator [Deltaproteobacteria bacterium]